LSGDKINLCDPEAQLFPPLRLTLYWRTARTPLECGCPSSDTGESNKDEVQKKLIGVQRRSTRRAELDQNIVWNLTAIKMVIRALQLFCIPSVIP
jgi:hypothetical protein